MSFSRREFLVAVPAVALVPALAVSRSPQSPGGWEPGTSEPPVVSNASVVSFHLDQPYLDLTGLQKPYVPPVGMRSGASLAALSQEEVLSRFYGFI